MLIYGLICCIVAVMLMLVAMPKFLPYLKKLKFGQTIYELGPQAHLAKQGTPNMGGVVIAGAAMAAFVIPIIFSVIFRLLSRISCLVFRLVPKSIHAGFFR